MGDIWCISQANLLAEPATKSYKGELILKIYINQVKKPYKLKYLPYHSTRVKQIVL